MLAVKSRNFFTSNAGKSGIRLNSKLGGEYFGPTLFLAQRRALGYWASANTTSHADATAASAHRVNIHVSEYA